MVRSARMRAWSSLLCGSHAPPRRTAGGAATFVVQIGGCRCGIGGEATAPELLAQIELTLAKSGPG